MKTRPSSAFTLIELLTVMAIMVVLMGLSMAAFKDLGRGSGMRGAVQEFKSGIGLARQYAVTRRIPNRLRFGNETPSDTTIDYTDDRGYFCIEERGPGFNNWILQGGTNFFPDGIRFDTAPGGTNAVEFKVDGSCPGAPFGSDDKVGIIEQASLQTTVLKLHRQTGRVKVLSGQP